MIKTWLIAIFAVIVLMPAPAEARGGIPIIYNMGHSRVETVAKLPDTPEFTSPTGHVDLGWAYADYSVYGIPLGFGAAEGYVLDTGEGYYVLEAKDFAPIEKATGLSLKQPYKLSAFGHLWGWPILLLLIGGGIFFKRMRDEDGTAGLAAADYEHSKQAAIERLARQQASDQRPQPGAQAQQAPAPSGFGRKGLS